MRGGGGGMEAPTETLFLERSVFSFCFNFCVCDGGSCEQYVFLILCDARMLR